MRLAVEMAQAVKNSPARSISELAGRYLREPAAQASPGCCGPSSSGETPPDKKKPGKSSCC